MSTPPESIHQLYNNFQERNILISVCGRITQDLVIESKRILSSDSITGTNENSRWKLISIFVELAQNVLRYSAIKDLDKKSGSGILLVGETQEHYEVSSGNLIRNEQLDSIQTQCNDIEKMSPDEIKKHYKKRRKEDPPEGSFGAGLGLLEIAMRSSVPIVSHFEKHDKEHMFFSINAKILKS